MTGDLANGIYAGSNSVSIRNIDHIETFGLGAAGIFANGANSYVENGGTVVTHGGFYDPTRCAAIQASRITLPPFNGKRNPSSKNSTRQVEVWEGGA